MISVQFVSTLCDRSWITVWTWCFQTILNCCHSCAFRILIIRSWLKCHPRWLNTFVLVPLWCDLIWWWSYLLVVLCFMGGWYCRGSYEGFPVESVPLLYQLFIHFEYFLFNSQISLFMSWFHRFHCPDFTDFIYTGIYFHPTCCTHLSVCVKFCACFSLPLLDL